MKWRDQDTGSNSSDTLVQESKRRKVTFSIYEKLNAELGCKCQTVSWLDSDTEMNERKKEVTKLQSKNSHKKKLQRRVVSGCQVDSYHEHAKADQHVHTMPCTFFITVIQCSWANVLIAYIQWETRVGYFVVINTNKRTSLTNESLDNLLYLTMKDLPLS